MSKNIVILGAGFGGLRCALQLARALARDSSPPAADQNDRGEGWKVVLVDRSAYHLYSPRLYERIIPGRKQSAVSCQLSISEILRGTRVEFAQGEVERVDCKGRVVEVERPPLNPPLDKGGKESGVPLGKGEKEGVKYDYLVLALGAGTDYFGIEGLEKHACTLKSVEDAERIRESVEGFLGAHNSPQPSLIFPPKADPPRAEREGDRSAPPLNLRGGRGSYDKPFSIVIGGAGATGVEVAAELAYLFRNVPREKWSVTLVEAFSAVLWMFPKAVGEYADKRLRALGVHVMLDTCIKSVKYCPSPSPSPTRGEGDRRLDGVEVVLAPRPLKHGENEKALVCDFLPEHEKRVRADLLLWAGGIRANPLLATCSMAVDRKGRLEVDEYLQVKSMEHVFAIGDNATLINPKDQKPVPAIAQAALEQGKLVAENIGRLIKAKTGDPISVATEIGSPNIQLLAYQFHDFSAIIPLANRDGVAYVGKRVIRGFLAWFLRKAADCRYFASILGWWRAIKMIFYQ